MISELKATQPHGVVVLGMHRSGTSAVAGLLAEAGFFVGRSYDLLPAAGDNPKGFFERFDVTDLNNDLLTDAGGSWDHPPPRQAVVDRAHTWRPRIEATIGAMAADAHGLPIVLKDPRMSLLLPAWLAALGNRFALVLVDRNPLEVAMSMHRRDGRPIEAALELWQIYCAELLCALAGQTVWFAHYEDLLQNPELQTSALLRGLDARFAFKRLGSTDRGGAQGSAQVGTFIVDELRHQRVATADSEIEQSLNADQLALWRQLRQTPEGWVTLDASSALHVRPPQRAFPPGAAWMTKSAPTPTPRGALRLARHHYRQGGLARVASRAATEALRLMRRL